MPTGDRHYAVGHSLDRLVSRQPLYRGSEARGIRLAWSTYTAMAAIVGDSNNNFSGGLTEKISWVLARIWVASKECPPSSKKLLLMPIRGTFNVSCQRATRVFGGGGRRQVVLGRRNGVVHVGRQRLPIDLAVGT